MFRFLDDVAIADAPFEVIAPTLPEVFRQAAEALLGVMVDNPQAIAPQSVMSMQRDAPTLDLLLYHFLEELIFHKDASQMLLRVSGVTVTQIPGGWKAQATAAGERIDPVRHYLGIDVKAVTLHRLEVNHQSDGSWRAEVVLDV